MSDELALVNGTELVPTLSRELSVSDTSIKKHFLTRFLPGDIAHCRDGTIAQIREAKVKYGTKIGQSKFIDWNFEGPSVPRGSKVVEERYWLVRIPGQRQVKRAWYLLGEFKQVIKGPLHDVLGGKSGLEEIPEDEYCAAIQPSTGHSYAPLGRVRMRRNGLAY